MSGMSSPFTCLRHSKSSSLRRRRRGGRHATERQTSTEKHNGGISTSTSGVIQSLSFPFWFWDISNFFWIFDVLSIFCQTEEGAPPVVGKWRFVRVEAPTAGWSLPCWLLLSPYSCPASAEGTSWGRIRSAESWIKIIIKIYDKWLCKATNIIITIRIPNTCKSTTKTATITTKQNCFLEGKLLTCSCS